NRTLAGTTTPHGFAKAAFQRTALLRQCTNPLCHSRNGSTQKFAHFNELTLTVAQPLVRMRPRKRLDPSNSGAHAGLTDDHEKADNSGVSHVCTAAQFRGISRDLHNTNDIAVLLAEQRHRASGNRLLV